MFQLDRIWIMLHLQTPVPNTARSSLPVCYSVWEDHVPTASRTFLGGWVRGSDSLGNSLMSSL